jgi:tyrosyl-tRNA synthetase
MEEIARFAALEGAELRAAKQALAYEATRVVHGDEAAETARKAAGAAFGGSGEASELVPTHAVNADELKSGLKTIDLLATSGLAASKSAARRLVEQGGVRIGERKVTAIDDVLRSEEVPPSGVLLHAGKKHVRRIVRS